MDCGIVDVNFSLENSTPCNWELNSWVSEISLNF